MIAFITDVHLGNHRKFARAVAGGTNARFRETLIALQRAIDQAESNHVDAMVIAGDLFDSDKPTPVMLACVRDVIESAPFPIYCLVGNHDRTSYSDDDYSFAPLASSVQAQARHLYGIEEPTFLAKSGALLMLIPTLPLVSDSLLDSIREVLAHQLHGITSPPQSYRYLIVHAGVMDENTPAFLRSPKGALDRDELFNVMDQHDIDAAICGDWHDHKSFVRQDHKMGKSRRIVQLGALVPTGFDNPGLDLYGRIMFLPSYGSEKQDCVIGEINGPRFIKMNYEEEIDAYMVKDCLAGYIDDTIYVKARVLPENAKHARADLTALYERNRIGGFELELSKEFVKLQTQAAASRARSAASFEDALDAYLKVTPLPEGVRRTGVVDKIRSLMPQKEA